MYAYIARRLITTLPVMLMVAFFVFVMLRLAPGDPAALIAGDEASMEQLEQIRRNMGLDQPIFTQFLTWLGNFMRGDLGVSFLSGTPVFDMIKGRISPTLIICAATIILSILVAVPLGIIAAWRQGRLLDRAVMAFSVVGFSVPNFLVGYVLIYFVSLKLGWLPVQGYKPPSAGLVPFIKSITLPVMVLSTVYVALIARITRSSVIEVMGEDFIRTARSKGLRERLVFTRHGLRNAAVPIITIIGIGVAALIGGVVVTESVFNLPGLGRLVVEAVLARDFPVVQGLILLFSFTYIIVNLIVDILYTFFDPRISY